MVHLRSFQLVNGLAAVSCQESNFLTPGSKWAVRMRTETHAVEEYLSGEADERVWALMSHSRLKNITYSEIAFVF